MNRKLCCTDFHGMWNLWEQIKNYCDETDTIYFLGDACDRGKDGLKIIQDLLADKRVVYLRGNHEDMMVNAAPYLFYEDRDDWCAMVWRNNGNYCTENDFTSMPEQEQKKLIQQLAALPDKMTITNNKGQEILLCHAGIAPNFDSADFLLDGGLNSYIWNRRHLFRPWAAGYDNLYIVHGHTPVPYVTDEGLSSFKDKWSIDYIPNTENEKGILTYANGHKFDLDLASFSSNRVALFDLDELKVEKYFVTEED